MNLLANIKKLPTISGKIKGITVLSAKLDGVTIVAGESKPYEGPYSVIPTFEQRILETKDRALLENVTVEPIPITKTSNTSGGNTVIIGG